MARKKGTSKARKKTVYKTVKHKGVKKGGKGSWGLYNGGLGGKKRKPRKPKAGTKAVCTIKRKGSSLVAVCSGFAYPVLTKGGRGSVKRARAALTRVRGNLCRKSSGAFTRCRGKVAGKGKGKAGKGKLRCKKWTEVPSPIYGHKIRRCADFVRSRK